MVINNLDLETAAEMVKMKNSDEYHIEMMEAIREIKKDIKEVKKLLKKK